MNFKKVAASISSYSKIEDISNRERERLLGKLKQYSSPCDLEDAYNETVRNLENQYPIKNKTLLIKSVSILVFVVSVFFLHSIPEMSKYYYFYILCVSY